MQITLKNVKVSELASEETVCFQASTYIDGKTTGTTVGNDGHGGCNYYHGGNAYERISEYAKTLPEIETNFTHEGKPFMMKQDVDSLIGEVLDKYLLDKDLKRLCRTKVCYRIPGEVYAEGEYHSFKATYEPRHKELLVQKYGQEVFILNEEVK